MAAYTETTAALSNSAATLAAKPRQGVIIANPSDTVMTFRVGSTATATIGVPISAGSSVKLTGLDAPDGSISIFCAGTSKTYVAYEW